MLKVRRNKQGHVIMHAVSRTVTFDLLGAEGRLQYAFEMCRDSSLILER